MKPLPKPLPCPVCGKEPEFSPSTTTGRIDLECYGWIPWYGYHEIRTHARTFTTAINRWNRMVKS